MPALWLRACALLTASVAASGCSWSSSSHGSVGSPQTTSVAGGASGAALSGGTGSGGASAGAGSSTATGTGGQGATAAATALRLQANWIPFSAQRKAQTAAYDQKRYHRNTWSLTNPKVIVLHFTESNSWTSTRALFASNAPNDGSYPGVCAHYLIDQSGIIHELVPTNIVCRHTIGLNYTAIGIEMVQVTAGDSASWADRQILNRPAQVNSALALVRMLMAKFHITKSNVVGHATANSSPYFVEYTGRRNDHQDWQGADVAVFRSRL